MQEQLKIPSRIHEILHPQFQQREVRVFLKRDDEIHPAISGNKWRKLKYNIAEIKENGLAGFITFGGAFSNHLAASAYAGHLANLKMVGIIRGEEPMANETLAFAKSCGMHLKQIPRSEYAQKNDTEFLKHLQNQYPNYLIIPEGGSNVNGVQGCMEILAEDEWQADYVCCPLGSATTFAGLILSAKKGQTCLGFPAVKGGDYLREDVNNFIAQAMSKGLVADTFTPVPWQLQTNFHFGGFGKITPDLIAFMNAFYTETGVPLDPVYTGKMMFGLVEMIKADKIPKGSKVLVIHTGGLQGIKGMNTRLRNKGLKIDYEKITAAAFPNPHT